jgi:amidase
VNVEGALLSLGDLHAAMGDAEITGTALETSGDVVLRCEVRSRDEVDFVGTPHFATREVIGSIGCRFGQTLDSNVKTALGDMADASTVDMVFHWSKRLKYLAAPRA